MKKFTYKSSGVDIGQANAFVRAIQKSVTATKTSKGPKGHGAFGAAFALDIRKYRHPVLVSSTDGVGTKLLLAKTLNKHDTVGIDLVAMNVNDILCAGARPLFFLDYIACGKLNVHVLKSVVKGIAAGCRQAGCALVGGETAEMPGMYRKEDYDLAGFAVGVVEKDKFIDGSRIAAGDRVIGLASSGLHSNGYSLVRKVFSLKSQRLLARELLTPTRIYVQEILALLEHVRIKGIAHITGGAFYEKLTKVLPPGLCFDIDKRSWPVLNIFQKVQKKGRINESEMFRTFNMGIGLALVVADRDVARVKKFFKTRGIPAYLIGKVIRHNKKKIILKGLR